MPYSRSVQQIHPLPGHMLPDPGLVFDTLLKREAVCPIAHFLELKWECLTFSSYV